MLLIVSTLWTISLVADDRLERPNAHRVEPIGRTITHEGVEYKAYTLQEYKQLAHLILDYHLLWSYSLSLELEIESWKREKTDWKLRVETWKEAAEVQKSRGDQLSKLFDAEHALRLKIEKSHRTLGWIPWALVVVESVAIGVLGVYSGAQMASTN